MSISNLFSGDAATSLLTMSGLKEGTKGLGPSQSYAAFFTHPAGILRAVILTIGEMAKEVFQARRQVRRGVEPRIHRGGSYVALRAVTNVFLRDLNVALVVEAMMKGSKSIYVDFVDYDEIAHHAGVTRSESLAAFYGLDDVRAQHRAGHRRRHHPAAVPRRARLRPRPEPGRDLPPALRGLARGLILDYFKGAATVTAATGEVEAWGPVNMLIGQLSGQDSVSGRITKRAISDRDPEAPVGPSGVTEDTTGPGDAPAEITVVGSGNLGGVWFSQHPSGSRSADIERLHPGLLAMLAAHPGIGFVVVATDPGPVALGAEGTHDLTTGEVVGEDPLAPVRPGCRRRLHPRRRRTQRAGHLRQLAVRPRARRGRGVRGARRLPRRPGRLADPADARAPGGVGDRRGPARRPRPAARRRHGAPPARALARAAGPPHGAR